MRENVSILFLLSNTWYLKDMNTYNNIQYSNNNKKNNNNSKKMWMHRRFSMYKKVNFIFSYFVNIKTVIR